MNDAMPIVLPLALGAAVSPALLTIVLLLLSGKVRPRARAWAFTAGVAVVTAAYVGLLATVGRNIQLGSSHPSDTSRVIHGAAALALVGLGIHALRRSEPTGPHPSKVRQRMAEAGLGFFVGIGAAAMATNFSSLVLMVPAVHEITKDLRSWEQAGPLLLVFFCACAPALLPVLAVTVLGHRSDAMLGRLSRFTSEHARQINAGIAFLFAALLGISALK